MPVAQVKRPLYPVAQESKGKNEAPNMVVTVVTSLLVSDRFDIRGQN